VGIKNDTPVELAITQKFGSCAFCFHWSCGEIFSQYNGIHKRRNNKDTHNLRQNVLSGVQSGRDEKKVIFLFNQQ